MADKKGDDGKKGKKGGGGGDVEDIMSSAEMKPLLAKAKHGDPVSCAIALTSDKDGVILLDKRKKPKKVLAEMRRAASAAGLVLETTTLRYGRATVDPDVDAALVTFTVNKDAPGAMRPKMLERLKKAGFSKVEFSVDAALDSEADEDDASPAVADGAAGDGAAGDARANGVAPDAAGMSASEASASAPTPAGSETAGSEPADSEPATGQPAPGGPPIADLQRALADMLKQISAVLAQAPVLKGALLKLAQDATAAVKTGDAAQAQPLIEQLRQALADAAGVAGAGAADGPSPAMKASIQLVEKSRVAWSGAVKKIERDIEMLLGELSKVYKDHGIAGDLEKIFRAKVDPMMTAFDTDLEEKLEEIAQVGGPGGDPAAIAKLAGEARDILERYRTKFAAEPLIAKLDANPVTPIAVGKTMTLTLQTLDKTLASVAGAV